MGTRIVKNYPSPRLMQTIGATNQTPPEAIGELVANCFDARIPGEQLSITIDLRNGKIAVVDNGKGMTEPILEKAVCIAEDMSQYIERGESAKGHFGMGFKTSCATLGKFYEIYTRPVDENNEYHVEFDVSSYATRPSGADAWDIGIEDSPRFSNSPLKYAPHGTAFVISRLNNKDVLTQPILDYLGEAFKGHIETGDTITITDDYDSYTAQPKKRIYVKGTRVPIDIKCGPDNSLRIKGWVALDKQTHNDGLYGFNIYRHHQLVDSWNKDWFRRHLMTSRVFGEVSMDFLDATFYKQGLQQSESWAIASATMKEFLKPIVSASEKLSKQGNIRNSQKRNEIIDILHQEYGISDDSYVEDNDTDTSSAVEDTSGGDDIVTPPPTITNKFKTFIGEKELKLKNGTVIPITYTTQLSSGGFDIPFDMIYDDEVEDEPQLQVITYTNHPLWTGKENPETVKTIAIADAIFRVLVTKLSVQPSEAFKIKNSWIMTRINGSGAIDE